MTINTARLAPVLAGLLWLGPARVEAGDSASPLEAWRVGAVLALVPDQAWQQAELTVTGSTLSLGSARAGEVLTFSPLPASCGDVVLEYVDETGWGVTVYLEIGELVASPAGTPEARARMAPRPASGAVRREAQDGPR